MRAKRIIDILQEILTLKDIGHVVFALSYFDDAEKERMPVMRWETQWKTIKGTIQAWAKAFSNPHT